MYLFFFRVLQATWFSAAGRGARKVVANGRRASDGSAPVTMPIGEALLILEPPELAGRSFMLGHELTVGRSAGCTITLDDT